LPGYDAVATAGDGDHFVQAKADAAFAFFSQALQHSKGKWAGQPFELQPWQKAIVGNLIGWQRADGTRRYRSAYIEVARKNGKSTLIAGLALWSLLASGENSPEVYCCASSRDQAAIVGDACKAMIRACPALSSVLEIYRNTITCAKNNGKIEILSADAGTKHGKSPSCIIYDELHTAPNRDLWDAMQTGVGARQEPLSIAITTAGHDKHSLCYQQREFAEKVRSGTVVDRSHLPVLFGADKDADWKSPAVWRAANPNLGVSVEESFLQSECEKAQELPGHEIAFRQLYLCQWTETKKRWISLESWAACAAPEIDEQYFAGKDIYLGVDLSTTTDLSSVAVITVDENEQVAFLSYAFCPEEGVRRRSRVDRVPYDVWASQGSLITTPGNVIDYQYVAQKIRDISKIARSVKAVGYDPWNATQFAVGLQQEGLPMLEVRQGFRSLSEPAKALEALVLGKSIKHGNHAVANFCMASTCIDTDPAGNIKPSKSSSTERIDCIAALVTALACMVHKDADNKTSIYEEGNMQWV